MQAAHARLLCRLAFGARERGLDIWAGRAYRGQMYATCRPTPRLVDDGELERRCRGLLRQLGHVGMLWLDGKRVACRVEFLTREPPSSAFPGPERVPSLVIVDHRARGEPLRRDGWAVILARDLDRYFDGDPAPARLSDPAREARAEVVEVEPRGENAYRMTLGCPTVALSARPGQFILLECVGAWERRAFRRAGNRPWSAHKGFTVDPKLPVLRRPFGLHRFSGPDYAAGRLAEPPPFPPGLLSVIAPGREPTFDVLFKVVGRGTQRLASMRPGEKLSLRGPLGAPVEIRPDLETAILVAGGMGAGPLFALAQELRRQGRNVHAFLGAASAASAPVPLDEFAHIGARAAVVTEQEDGMLVTQHLERELARAAAGITEIFACGPVGMLREVARIASPAIPVQVLLEQRMACGMGVCRGCVVRMRAEGAAPVYHTVCREGPAFRAEEVAWEEISATVG